MFLFIVIINAFLLFHCLCNTLCTASVHYVYLFYWTIDQPMDQSNYQSHYLLLTASFIIPLHWQLSEASINHRIARRKHKKCKNIISTFCFCTCTTGLLLWSYRYYRLGRVPTEEHWALLLSIDNFLVWFQFNLIPPPRDSSSKTIATTSDWLTDWLTRLFTHRRCPCKPSYVQIPQFYRRQKKLHNFVSFRIYSLIFIYVTSNWL